MHSIIAVPAGTCSPPLSRRGFLRQLGLAAAMAGLGSAPSILAAQRRFGTNLPSGTPEAQGLSSRAVIDFLDAIAASKHEFHSLIIARHGQVVTQGYWTPYRPKTPQMMYSMSKSFTSTGIGLAVAERRLTVEDPVIGFFPDDLPTELSDHLKALRVKHLLSMSVGHAQDSTGSLWSEQNWARKFLSLPVAYPPGSAFLYNSGASYMLSAIVSKVTGQTLLSYLRPRLFQPLGIEQVSWETCPRGINTGGWGLKIPTEGLAKFGQLCLGKGTWNGRQILPAAWVEEATTFKIQQPAPDLEKAKRDSDWHQGYGYQFWRCRHGAYRGDGAFGQYTIVLPAQDAVIAITSETSNMQGILNLVWEHLLPAMGPSTLARDRAAHNDLAERLGKLSLALPRGQRTDPLAESVSGKSYRLESGEGNRTLSVKFKGDDCLFTLEDANGSHRVHCGLGKWRDGETDMPGTPPKLTQGSLPPVSKVAAAAAWSDNQTLEMIWRYYETPHHDQVTCRFAGEAITVEFLDSMTAMRPGAKDKRPVLKGRLQA